MDTPPAFFPVQQLFAALLICVSLAGCGNIGLPEWAPQRLRPEAPSEPETSPLSVAGARTAEALDRSTRAERAQAVAASGSGRVLGTTIASLGSPTEPGFWLKTPLVATEQPGIVRSVDSGMRVSVTLIPIEGPATAGSRISLAAMRMLELPLTSLAELDVSQAR